MADYPPLKNIYGPYEKKVVLEQGSTTINGPHQGAIVDTPDGQWAFFISNIARTSFPHKKIKVICPDSASNQKVIHAS